MAVRLKPHHLLCVHGFKGKGYSPEYVQNFWNVLGTLKTNPEVEITVEDDAICAPCPNRREHVCTQQNKITALDESYLKTLNLKSGQKLSWEEAKKTVAKKVSLENFEENCHLCSWKALGYCRDALFELKKTFP